TSASSLFPGGERRSSKCSAESSERNFRKAAACMSAGKRLEGAPSQMRSVSRLAKLRITRHLYNA
ncbi:MAG TPA: hypothetical protein VJ655_05440, partial [Caulobacter sp.]